jgi:glucosyl-dolichyl phosphate glucuronosyltransferase
MPAISAIIPTHNRAASLVHVLESLLAQDLPRDQFEVVVVANACTDETVDVCEAFVRRGLPLKTVDEPRLGLHYARNSGARAASAAVLAYTDDDVICSPQWLQSLMMGFDDPQVGCAGGPIKVRIDQRPIWFSRFPGIFAEVDYGVADRALKFPEDLYGANLALRRDLLFSLGGFEPDAFGRQWAGAGETGLLRKLYRSGAKVMYIAAAQVEHIVPVEHTTLDYAIRRMQNHAIAACILACDGRISRFALRLRALKFKAAAHYFQVKRWFARPGSEVHSSAVLLAEYARARSRFDRRLLHETSLHPLVTRTDWIKD